jgi:hypothetical protein
MSPAETPTPPEQIGRRMGVRRLTGYNYRVNLVVRTIHQDIIAIDQAPFVTPWWSVEVVLLVIYLLAAIPILLLDAATLLPIVVLYVFVVVSIVVVMLLGIVIMMFLGKGETA